MTSEHMDVCTCDPFGTGEGRPPVCEVHAPQTKYRIDYTITRRTTTDDDFVEIGFGSSGAWDSVDFCAHMVEAAVQHDEWETTPGMPEPSEVRHAITASRETDA